MNSTRLARAMAVTGATLTGLGLFFICLRAVSAQAPAAQMTEAASAQIWHVAASPGEGLVGYWKFDQVFDGKTLNSALLTNQTTLSNGASITTSVTPSVTVADTGVVLLDGVNDHAVISDATALDVSPSSFSLAAWVRRATVNNYDAIYDSGTEANKWWVFIADNGVGKVNRFGFGVRGLSEVYSTRSITDTNWHHLAVVKTSSGASNLTFYVDGIASGVVTVTNVITPTGTKRIGALLDGSLSAFFGGSIDELRLYNRALSAAEVGRLAAGRGCVTDGATWPTAFEDLQCALNVAHSGDQIWVAGGTYRPGADKLVSYRLVNGVSLFGGFNGSESSPGQRPAFDPNAPLTALSGDAFGNDVPASFSNYVENTCNVVVAGSLAAPILVSATVDGLAIQDGNADAGAACGFPSAATGGGLLAIGASPITLNNVAFRFNRSSGPGGGMANGFGPVNISHALFFSNSANIGGGLGIGGGNVTITASSFVSNSASQGGGAIFVLGTLTLVDSSVTQNTSQDFNAASDFAPVGGGVLVSGTAVISNTQFFSNTAILPSILSNNLAGGGGLAVTGSLALTGGDFRDNDAEHGGGLQVIGSAAIQRSLFQHNNAGSGGGVFADGDLSLINNRLIDNTALEILFNQGSLGGGLLLQNGGLSSRVANNLFLGNRALTTDATTPRGAAMSIDGLITLVSNNTMVDRGLNSASAASVTGTTGLFNNIITSHTVAIESLGGLTFDDYNLFNGNTVTATGVISPGGHSRIANPRFVALALDDFRLRLDSPAVDAGDNNRVPLIVTTDLDGGPRFVNVPGVPDTGAGSAPIVDIGAYEVNDRLFLPLVER